MKWLRVLFLSTVLSFSPFLALAGDCYFLAGYGSGKYNKSHTNKFEDRILANKYVEGSYIVDSRSRPYQLGGGCDLGRYLAVEADYFQGLQTEVVTTAALCADVLGRQICSSPGLIRRVATLEGWELSLLGKLPMSERWSLTGRLGALQGVARVIVTLPEVSGTIGLSAEKRGTLPILGIGLLYRPTLDFSLAFEHKPLGNKGQVNLILGRWYF